MFRCGENQSGHVATYIPQLGKGSLPKLFATNAIANSVRMASSCDVFAQVNTVHQLDRDCKTFKDEKLYKLFNKGGRAFLKTITFPVPAFLSFGFVFQRSCSKICISVPGQNRSM